jgi:hypothetical protein
VSVVEMDEMVPRPSVHSTMSVAAAARLMMTVSPANRPEATVPVEVRAYTPPTTVARLSTAIVEVWPVFHVIVDVEKLEPARFRQERSDATNEAAAVPDVMAGMVVETHEVNELLLTTATVCGELVSAGEKVAVLLLGGVHTTSPTAACAGGTTTRAALALSATAAATQRMRLRVVADTAASSQLGSLERV